MYINWENYFLYIFYDKRNLIKNIFIVYIDWKYKGCVVDFFGVFDEIKNLRRSPKEVIVRIVGIEEDIAGQFAKTYEEILTAVDDSEEVETLKVVIDEDLTQGEIQSVLKVDADLIKKASKNHSLI